MPTILVIEDDPDMLELERRALSAVGHTVLVAANGQEALQQLERDRPCVIVLDLMMPIMDGLTFLAERRRLGLGADVPVVCLSAAGPALVSKALHLGAKECLGKPASLEELCERVTHYCGEATPES